MKRTQLKDTRRNIWREKVSFISIAIISLLAVAAYLGINFASEAMKENANNFYQKTNFRDIEITSTMMLGEDDIQSLGELPGVQDVEGVYVATGKVPKGMGYENVSVVSMTERINTLQVIDGRLPENEKECVLEKDLVNITGLKPGDTVSVIDAHGDCPEYLKDNTFTITGVVYHPDLYIIQTQTPGNRYVMVSPEVFNKDDLRDSYMKAVVRIDKPEGVSYFAKNYNSLLSTTKKDVEEWSKDREVKRREYVKELAGEGLDDARKQLEDGEKKLKDARTTLDEKKKELEDGEKKLEEGKAQLDAAAAELEEGRNKLLAGEDELAAGEAQLNEGKRELDKAKAELDSGKAELDKAESELNAGKKKLDDANSQLVEAYNFAEDEKEYAREHLRKSIKEVVEDIDIDSLPWAKPRYIDDAGNEDLLISELYVFEEGPVIDIHFWTSGDAEQIVWDMVKGTDLEVYYVDLKEYISKNEIYQKLAKRMAEVADGIEKWEEGKTQYIQGLGEYEEAYSQYQEGLSKYNEGLEEYNQGLDKYNSALAEYDSGRRELDDGWAKYNSAKAEYDEKYAEYEAGLQTLKEGRDAIRKGEEEYATGLEEFQKAKDELEKAEKEIENIAQCHFVTLDTKGNSGFMYATESAGNIGKLGMTFALLFVLLGALVIYATVGRIIDEQRTLVGTQKALGFFSGEVFRKYLAFGAIATGIGIVGGLAAAYILVQRTILSANEPFCIMGFIPQIFLGRKSAIIFGLGILLSGFAVFWACAHLLKETAKALMQPPAPKGRNKTETKTGRGSIYSRLIVRNMLMDWRRVLVTMASVAGCCVLLVIGFTLKNSIVDAIDYQFDKIIMHKDKISYDINTSETVESDVEKVLKAHGVEYMKITSEYRTLESPEGLTAAEILVVDSEEVDKYFHLRDVKTKEITPLPKEGIVITRQISEIYDLSVGDTFTIYNNNMDPFETQVSGIIEYYFGKIMFMSREAYEGVFGEPAVGNAFWAVGDYSEDALQNELTSVRGLESITSTGKTRERFIESTASLQAITFLLILAAGLMAYFVLLNLINMYLNQKKKELTIMRVNGFTTKEVIRYVAGESVLTTLLGIILGLGVGSLIAYSIVRFLESAQFGLIRHVSYSAWIYSALLTAVFALIINAIALRKVKHLKLSDIA